jgi:hypothetical protein
LEATVAVNWLIVGCRFGGTTTSTGNLISYTGASRVVIRNCRLTVNTSGTAIAASATGTVLARDTIFDCGTTTYNGAFASTSGHADFEGCTFDNTTITAAGTFYAIQMANVNDVLLVHRCKFIQQTQTFTNGIRLVAGAKARIRDIVVPANSGTAFYNSVTLGNGSYIAPVSAAATGEAEYVSQSIGVAATIPFCEFWAANATSTVPSITLPNGFYPGQLLKITIYNNSGVGWAGNVNFTNGTTFGAVTTNAGIAGLVVGEFEYSDVGLLGTYSWTARSLKLGSAN